MVQPSSAAHREGPFARWARFSVRRRGTVLLGALLVVVLLGVIAITAGGQYSNEFTIPDAEAQRATDLLEERFPSQAGDSATLVVETDVDDPAVKQRLDDLLAEIAALPHVTGVVSPYDNPAAISDDRRIAYATIQYDKQASEVPVEDVEQLVDVVEGAAADGFRTEVGGWVVTESEQPPPGESALIAVAAAIVILLIAFGSVIAMGLPIATALAGLSAGLMGISIATAFLDLSDFTPVFAAMIGLGVGIDYALFVVTRFREGLHVGLDVEDAVAQAIDTAGRAVTFAGTAVAIALLGLVAIGIPLFAALGLAAAIIVLTCVLVALTILPALLGYVGHRIDRWRIPGLRATEGSSPRSIWYRWSHRIQRRPWPYLLGSAALLLLLTIPLFDLNLAFSDAGNNPTSFNSRRAYDLLTEGFGPGFNGPLIMTVERSGGLDPAALERLSESLRQDAGVAAVMPPTTNPAGDTAVISVIPTTSPQDEETPELVRHLRDDVIPTVASETGMTVYVGGVTAATIDIGDRISDRMPLFFAVVIGLSFLLLTAVFRSLVIPLKAGLMNLVSIGASYGVLVAVFQWGWAKDLFGVAKEGPLELFLPMVLFALLFGLSMDYEVFLLSRVREQYVRTGDAREAVAHGLSITARVIASAAAIMASVFLSFVLGPDRIIKQFGLGLATAIFVDATVVRLILVPATMELLGDWNWWFPRWLDRLVPRLNIEGAVAPVAADGD